MPPADDVVIGLTTEVLAPPWYEGRERYQLFTDYSHCLRPFGARLLLIPGDTPTEHLPPLLDRLDGVLATGGDDADLSLLGGPPPTPECKPVPAGQQSLNLALAEAVVQGGMPLLGVCFGMQMIGLAQGARFIQHLDQAEAHTSGALHPVRLAAESQLAQWVGSIEIEVPSFHHQALGDAGSGPFQAIGWAPDGTLEAIEYPNHAFALGVQWHPERAPDSIASRQIFSRFVAAAAAYRNTRHVSY